MKTVSTWETLLAQTIDYGNAFFSGMCRDETSLVVAPELKIISDKCSLSSAETCLLPMVNHQKALPCFNTKFQAIIFLMAFQYYWNSAELIHWGLKQLNDGGKIYMLMPNFSHHSITEEMKKGVFSPAMDGFSGPLSDYKTWAEMLPSHGFKTPVVHWSEGQSNEAESGPDIIQSSPCYIIEAQKL